MQMLAEQQQQYQADEAARQEQAASGGRKRPPPADVGSNPFGEAGSMDPLSPSRNFHFFEK